MVLAERRPGRDRHFVDGTLFIRERRLTWRRLGLDLIVAGVGSDSPAVVRKPGALVWDLLGRRQRMGDLVDDVVAITGADREEVWAGVADLLSDWQDRGWVVADDG